MKGFSITKKVICCTLLLLIIIQFPFTVEPASAGSSYSFNVEYENLTVTMNSDGSCDYYYKIKFHCRSSGDPINVVDIYTPNKYYKLSTAKAKINGKTISKIKKSEYISPGVEIYLSRNIYPNEDGVLEFWIHIEKTITRWPLQSHGKVKVPVSYWDPDFYHGYTDVNVEIFIPEDLVPSDKLSIPSKLKMTKVNGGCKLNYEGRRSMDKEFELVFKMPKEYANNSYVPINWVFVFMICILILIFGIIYTSLKMRYKLAPRIDYIPPESGLSASFVRTDLTPTEVAILKGIDISHCTTIAVLEMTLEGKLLYDDNKKYNLMYGGELDPRSKMFKKTKIHYEGVGEYFQRLIQDLKEKMEGFDEMATEEYYTGYINKLWDQVKRIEYSPSSLGGFLKENLGMMLVHRKYRKKLQSLDGTKILISSHWLANFSIKVKDAKAGAYYEIKGRSFRTAVESTILAIRANLQQSRPYVEKFLMGIGNPDAYFVKYKEEPKIAGSVGAVCVCACACAYACACACAGGGR